MSLSWTSENRNISDLIPANYNPRKLTEKQAKDLSTSIDMIFGTLTEQKRIRYIGSGSTLIACEKTNRICYGMELDPKYCDVIVKRWEEYTGGKAEVRH